MRELPIDVTKAVSALVMVFYLFLKHIQYVRLKIFSSFGIKAHIIGLSRKNY